MNYLLSLLLVLVTASALAQDYATRFEAAWQLVSERYYWQGDSAKAAWDELKLEYEPQALAAQSETDFYRTLEKMYDELGDNHSVFVPPERVNDIREQYGDLPCLGVFAQAKPGNSYGHVSFELLEDDIGYIRLPDLASSNSAVNVRRAVSELQADGAQRFVLDMRGNPGGRLVEMMQTAGVFTTGFLWRTVTRWTLPLPYPAIGTPETELPLVILIDSEVNSAAEGLAGALQQRGRATIIGERSAGNVEAVLPFCLRDGSQAWIASGVLAPIGAPTWEGRGVTPDIEVLSQDALDAALTYFNSEAGKN